MTVRTIMSAAVALVCVLMQVGAPDAAAARNRLTLDAPRTTTSSVVFTGTAPARVGVRLQRYVDGGWRIARKTTSNRAGKYRMTVRRPSQPATYRTVWKGHRSPVQSVEPAPDACGARIAKADGRMWECTLAEEFTGDYDHSVWTALEQPVPLNGGACNVDDPRTVSVVDGALNLTVRPADPANGLACTPRGNGATSDYVSGSLSTYLKFSQKYGRFEARIKVQDADVPGLQEAFWLWPDVRNPDTDTTTWPLSGEIDIVEHYSQYPDLAIPYLHYSATRGPTPGVNTTWSAKAERGVWHTYALEWDADSVDIFVDGRLVLTNTEGAPNFRKEFIVNLTQLLGTGENAPKDPSLLPATMQVDYVHVWR